MFLACLQRTVYLSVLQRRRSDKTDDLRNRPRAALKNKQASYNQINSYIMYVYITLHGKHNVTVWIRRANNGRNVTFLGQDDLFLHFLKLRKFLESIK